MGLNLKKMASGIPLIGGMFDDTEEKALAEIQGNKDLWSKLQMPNLDWQNFNPEEYQSVGDYSPEDAMASLVKEDPAMKTEQLSALRKMAGLADSGLSAQDELSRNQLMRTSGREAKAGREAALDSARSRGVSGGGLEFALREMASQEAQDRAQDAGLQGAAQTANQRALYNQAYLSGLGNQRDQDYRTESGNAGILNNFNMANTGARNQAAQLNLANRQSIANQNTKGNNEAFQYNQEGRNATKQTNFGNQVTKLGGQTGAGAQMANAYAAQNAARTAERGANTDLLFSAGKKAMSGGAA